MSIFVYNSVEDIKMKIELWTHKFFPVWSRNMGNHQSQENWDTLYTIYTRTLMIDVLIPWRYFSFVMKSHLQAFLG